jgi:preprotein translocase subunit SecF
MRLLKLVPDNTNIDFMRVRNIALVLSILVTVASMALVFSRGLNFGIDFAGGQQMRVTFAQAPNLDQLRQRVESLVSGANLQESGAPNVIQIRTPLPEGAGTRADDAASNRAATALRNAITAGFPGARFDQVETVSPKVSGELLSSGAWAIALAMLGIAVYIWIRFEWQFGVGALVTLFHDVWMTLGFFSLSQLEFNLNVVAAILTIVGYSLNDTVVIYDRIRENLRKYRKMEIVPLLNVSLNETLSRTMVTSLSILLALFALLILGPDVIFGLTIAIFIGIFVGTYSSIYISSPILVWLRVTSGSFMPRDPASRAGDAPRNESYGARV